MLSWHAFVACLSIPMGAVRPQALIFPGPPGSIENVKFSERTRDPGGHGDDALNGGDRPDEPLPPAEADVRWPRPQPLAEAEGVAGAGPRQPPSEAGPDAAAGISDGREAGAGRSNGSPAEAGQDAAIGHTEAGKDAAMGHAAGLDTIPSRAELGPDAAAGGSDGPSVAPIRAEESNYSAAAHGLDVAAGSDRGEVSDANRSYRGPDAAAGGSEGRLAVSVQTEASPDAAAAATGPDAASGGSHRLDAISALFWAGPGAAANHSEALDLIMSRASSMLETARTLEALVVSLGRTPGGTAGPPGTPAEGRAEGAIAQRSEDDKNQARIKVIIMLAAAIALLAAAIICIRHCSRRFAGHGPWLRSRWI